MITREDLGRLMCELSPWVFLPIIDQAIARMPDDLGLGLLGVRTLARLGLRTPALERLESLGSALAGTPGVAELCRGVQALPLDVVPLSRRLKMAERNIEALVGRGVDLRGAFIEWSRDESRWEHLRAAGGNMIRRPVGALNSHAWLWVGDLRSTMTEYAARAIEGVHLDQLPQIVIEGANPPWLLMAISEQTARDQSGYAPRLTLLQADVNEFFEGMSVADLRDCLTQERLRCTIGPDATSRLERDAIERFDELLAGIELASSAVRRRCDPEVTAVARSFREKQRIETSRLHQRVREIYAQRDVRWWAERFDSALTPGGDEPLRVLVPSCRFTTYLQHSARSLCDALTRLGCEAQLLIEPNDNAHLSEWAYQRKFESFRPDLVVLTNYTRSDRSRTMPNNIPLVCWIQDSMGHLFSDATGAAQGALDFVVGHVYDDLLNEFGFRKDRALRFTVAADDKVFEPTEFSILQSQRYDAEISYVSHHSETPAAMLERLISETDGGKHETMIRRITDQIEALLIGSNHSAFRQPLRRMVESEVRLAHPGVACRDIAVRTYHMIAIPYAERIIRHEMIHWATRISARRGWRFALYGNGWEERPEFCDLARGAVEHGKALRDCYERSAVHLHASVSNPAHQRVQECALSGGLPLSRITRDALQVEYEIMRLGTMGKIEPCAADDLGGLVGFRITDDPELMAITSQLDRLGMSMEQGPDAALLWIERSEWERRQNAASVPRIDTRTRWLFGDYSQCAFTDEKGLERLVERAIERPQWRREVAGGISRRVHERMTIDVVAKQIIQFVKEGIDASAGPGR